MNDEKITWNVRAVETIATAMMKWPHPERCKRLTTEQKAAFFERHREIIEEIYPHVPRGFSAVGAACCKCAVVFGTKPVIEFLSRFKTMLFKGRSDPAYTYRMWFDSKRRTPRDHAQTYEMTVIACIAFCEHRPLDALQGGRNGQIKDVFDWDENWEFRSRNFRYEEPNTQPPIEEKQYYMLREAAELIGTIGEITLRHYCNSGRIPAEKRLGISRGRGGVWVMTKEQIEYVKKNGSSLRKRKSPKLEDKNGQGSSPGN